MTVSITSKSSFFSQASGNTLTDITKVQSAKPQVLFNPVKLTIEISRSEYVLSDWEDG